MIGGLFKSLGSSLGLSAPEAPKYEVPTTLPNLTTQSAAVVSEKAGLVPPTSGSAPGGAPGGTTGTVAQLLDKQLNQDQDMLGATKTLAHGMPQKEGVKWAAESCKVVQDKLPPEQRQAIVAADEFALVPNASNRTKAAAAAAKVDPNSPAGMAAKAASLADVPDGPAVPGSKSLVPTLVVGTVSMCVATAAKPAKPAAPTAPTLAVPQLQVPAAPTLKVAAPAAPKAPAAPQPGTPEAARNASAYAPFIGIGLAIAAGVAIAKKK